jgi:hypothetical protein
MTTQAKELERIFKELGSWARRWKRPHVRKAIA